MMSIMTVRRVAKTRRKEKVKLRMMARKMKTRVKNKLLRYHSLSCSMFASVVARNAINLPRAT